MLNKGYHKLLRRQLKKSRVNPIDNLNFKCFLEAVSAAYTSFDEDIYRLENILELSSKELLAVNKQLIKERDTTASKLEHIVDNIGGIIFETDLKGNFTYLNVAWEKYTGYSVKESLGRNYKEFISNTDINENKSNYRFFRKNKTVFTFKLKTPNKDIWFELTAKIFYNTENKEHGFIGTIIDITNLKEIEIQLHKASISKDEFLSTMSHEIRTPLNAVTGLSNVLLMETYLPHQEETLKGLKYSSEHLLDLINDLLDFDKIKSGKVEIIQREFNLLTFLDKIKEQFDYQANKKGLVFKLIKENNLPKNIIGDQVVLTQIIQNLLSNSFKFTAHGSVTLSIKKLEEVANRISLEFKVIDTGIGITKSKQEAIFESFVQASSETAIKYGGTGLGLSICRRLLKLQNSDLKLVSELGKGSMFFFKIDFKLDKKSDSFNNKNIDLKPTYKPLNINVLVAEDSKMNVFVLKKMFLNWNVNFTVAENGEEVTKLIDKALCDFDLILMDLQMPIMNGYEATKYIRELPDPKIANIPIIALTALAQTDIKEKTKQYKMNGFIGKPFEASKLYAVLKSYSST
ncbi:ATP-binding protein [Algibacter pacificus]|uniref:ATP-binding protein n=1 Tax=Algibacter pacificus TaxID=2599389 RepID=UPI0011C7D057|nr:ATP-binding protein [Algibacter pacificus]